jgi:hypothetical protein
MAPLTNQDIAELLPVGTRVEVRNRFDGSWSAGFRVHDTCRRGYWLRRLSDAAVLPTAFLGDDVRQQRH